MMQVFLNPSPSQPTLLSFTAEFNTIAYLETMTFVKFWDILWLFTLVNSQFSENTLGERKIGRFKDLSYFKKARLNLATGLATLKWSKGDKA